MLRLSHVTKTFNKGTVTEKRALTGVDLTLNDGDFVTVIGGNGAGKSTLLNMIAGALPAGLWRHRAGRQGHLAPLRGPARQVPGPRLPGPHARHRRRHADCGEPRSGPSPRQAPRPRLGRHQGREGRVPRASRPPWPGAGDAPGRKGRPALRRPAPGPDAAHGHPDRAQAAALSTSTRRPSTPRPLPRCSSSPRRSSPSASSPPSWSRTT